MKHVCDECLAIARDLKDAYAEAWASGDQGFKEAWLAINKLIGGTEQDVERAEELLQKADLHRMSGGYTAIGRLNMEKFAHEARTGHKLSGANYRLFPLGP